MLFRIKKKKLNKIMMKNLNIFKITIILLMNIWQMLCLFIKKTYKYILKNKISNLYCTIFYCIFLKIYKNNKK